MRIKAGNTQTGDAATLELPSGWTLTDAGDSHIRAALGGSLPLAVSAITRDDYGRITAYTEGGVTFTVVYSSSSGYSTSITDGVTTRTISRDTYGRVTGVT